MPSKCSDYDLETLVSDGLLPEKSIIQWRPALCEDRPYENMGEIVAFAPYYYRIQLHHLTPNSFVHISIFVHLCEAFLGIKPHFELFHHLFHLKPQPNSTRLGVVGVQAFSLGMGWIKCISHINCQAK